MDNIRNFTIIAHIDHGKSTLADRLLEHTKTIEKRRMQEQVLDSMDLERERGITIKMQPVTMVHEEEGEEYTLNLIDTPGHIDFSYEVSRALRAVEGALLLVDATQGVQAQTLSVLDMAREAGLSIIPVVTKTDVATAQTKDVSEELADLLGVDPASVIAVSGKTGDGVPELLSEIVKKMPAPEKEGVPGTRALVFDFEYSTHRGIIVYIRLLDGEIKKGDKLRFKGAGRECTAQEVGAFAPHFSPRPALSAGSIGYVVTGLKERIGAAVGDTLSKAGEEVPMVPGYELPRPVVWASVYPESQDDFSDLENALDRLQLSDPSITFEEESSGVLGRGFRCGFLGMLHLEIVTERLRREFNTEIVVATPSITYEVTYQDGTSELIYSPLQFPDHGTYAQVKEPWVSAVILTPTEHVTAISRLFYNYEVQLKDMEDFGEGRVSLSVELPLRELMRGFFDRLKSISSGYASLSYEITDMREADVVRMDVLLAEEAQPPFTRIVARRRIEEEARATVSRLKEMLPRQMFVLKIQAYALGRIIAAERLPALRKDVLTKGGKTVGGGDVTRKRKLLEKQKKGKKKMASTGTVHIPQKVFLDMMRGNDQD